MKEELAVELKISLPKISRRRFFAFALWTLLMTSGFFTGAVRTEAKLWQGCKENWK